MIGAGPAGLSAARHLRKFGIQVLGQFNISVADGVSPGELEGYSLQWPIRPGGGGCSAQKGHHFHARDFPS